MTLPELHDGDLVRVAKCTLLPIHVIGLVAKPGEFPYTADKEMRVLDALALAGGVANPVAEKIMVIRRMPHAVEPVRIAVSLQAAKNAGDNLTLAPGDVISVEQTPATVIVGIINSILHFGVGANVSCF